MINSLNIPEKSFVYPITFHFNDKGEWRYKSLEDIDFNCMVKDHRGQQQNFPQKQYNESTCTLGFQLAPDGNNDAMVNTLRQKAEELKSNI